MSAKNPKCPIHHIQSEKKMNKEQKYYEKIVL